MYVCMYVHTVSGLGVYYIHLYTYTYIYMCMYVCMYVCTYIRWVVSGHNAMCSPYIYIHISTYIYIFIRVYLYICTCKHKVSGLYICTYIPIDMFVCICIRTYTRGVVLGQNARAGYIHILEWRYIYGNVERQCATRARHVHWAQWWRVSRSTHMHMCTHACTHTYAHTHAHTHTHTRLHTHTKAHAHTNPPTHTQCATWAGTCSVRTSDKYLGQHTHVHT